MSEHWWRAHDSSVDHAKLILLNDKAHRNWFNLMCVASANDGVLPELKEVAVKLRVTPSKAAAAITELVAAGLFDRRDDGTFIPHNWDKRQFKHDARDPTNAQRQKEFRDRQKLLRNEIRGALRNGVTSVSAKRPDTDNRNITTTEDEDRGPSKGKMSLSPEALTTIGGRR